MTATTAPITVKLASIEGGTLDLRSIDDPAVLDATIESMTKVELAEAWHAVKAPEKAAKDEGEVLEALRGKIAAACDARMTKDEIVTIHGNARKRFTVSAYHMEAKGKVLDFLLIDPDTPQATKDRIRTLLDDDTLKTPVRKLGFANPKKGQ